MRNHGNFSPRRRAGALPVGHFKRGFGKKNQLIIPEVLAWSDNPEEIDRLGNRKEELYRQLVGEGGMIVLPGSRELLTALKEAGYPARCRDHRHRAPTSMRSLPPQGLESSLTSSFLRKTSSMASRRRMSF